MPKSPSPDLSARDALRASEIRYRRLFETARDGILLLNADSAQIEDVNPYLVEKLGYSKAEFLGKKLWEVGCFADRAESKKMFAELQATGYVRYDDLPLRTKTGSQLEVEFVSNVYDCDGIKIIQCNIRDITERKIAEAKSLRHIHLYYALSHCNKAILHCASEEDLFQRVCEAAVKFGSMKFCWIGIVDAETSMVRPAASFGDGVEILPDLEVSVDAQNPLGGGPTGTAIRENRPFWCNDVRTDPGTLPWREHVARAGWVGVASLPLHRNGQVFGAFVVYAGEANAFDEYARDLLGEMAADISFALDNFARESQRRQAERLVLESETRFRGLVEQAIAGIYIIQDGKLAYVNPRAAEIVDQGSTDDLIGTDPLVWVAEADRSQVAESMRRLLEGEAKSLALDFGVLRRDGLVIQVGAHAAYAMHLGRPAIIGLLQDISEQRRAEEEIRQYVAQLEAAFMSTVEVATIISEMRDPYTAGHEHRVAEIAVAIGAELGFDARRQEGLRVAGHLHDIGKITIPSEILSKPGKLSAIELQLIRTHAQASHNALKDVKFPWPVAQIALQHHERMDGSGYPQGLTGDEILLDARIMAVADVVEAMSSHRPYRPGLGIDKALAEIERGRGKEYDADAADACLRLFREGRHPLPA
ncbi:MAG: HD domain-containing phosphohydrolase [Burkholderiales bacterium]